MRFSGQAQSIVPARDLVSGRLVSRPTRNLLISPCQAAAAVEFTLEGLYLMRRLSKDTDGGTSVYGT